MDRRDFLKKTFPVIGATVLLECGLCSASTPARNLQAEEEDPNLFLMPRLRYRTLNPVADQWNAMPHGDDLFLRYLRDTTNVKVSPKSWNQRILDITALGEAYRNPDQEARVYSLPFIFMTGEGDFRLENDEAQTFREYFRRGGFLYADDCVAGSRGIVGDGGDFFYQAFVRETNKVFPDSPMRALPYDHEIYHCFFDFDTGAPRCQGQVRPDMGLFLEDRLVAFLTSGDIHCGWTVENQTITAQRHADSYRMGVNIVVYALTH